jgi:chaperone BCS1
MFETLQEQMQNQFLSGGLVLMIFGAILAYSRMIPLRLWWWLRRRIITTVDVPDDDEAFGWLNKWLAQHPYSTKKSRLLTISTRQTGNGEPQLINKASGPERITAPEVVFSPAPGRHFIKFEGRWLMLDRQRRQVDHSGRTGHRELFTLHTFCRDRNLIRRLVAEAKSVAFPPDSTDITICAPNYACWNVIGERPPRPLGSVILDEGVQEDLIEKIDEFVKSRDWYLSKGIPYQMGFLFYGPPGNGKTSTALTLASHFKCAVYLAKLAGLGDQTMRQLFSNIPRGALVLLEDVDSIFTPVVEEGPQLKSNDIFNTLTLSGFLNAMDGIMGADGRVLIMTTNHKEKLNPALIRKGRIDHQILFDNATAYQAEKMFLKFFPDEDPRLFIESGEGNSMAELQSVLIEHRDNPAAAVRALLRSNAA